MGNSPLDILLQNTLNKCQSQQQATAALYGPVRGVSAGATKVHTDGSCLNPGMPDARAGAGVFWGPGDRRNGAFRVAGAQTNNRAELTAVLLAILEAQPSLALQLFTDSQYAIHSICHWAPLWANTGWSCANADILKDIAHIISLRHAPISFIWVKGHSGNRANEEADTLAGRGTLLPGPILTYVSCPPPAWPTTSGLPEAAANLPKVFTTLPIVPLPKIIPLASLPKPEYTGLEPLHLQTEWEKQDVRLKRLMTAKSQGDFWHEWKSIVDPKVRPSAISAHDLRQVFLARMNPPQLLPVEFDALRHSTNRDWLALLPPSTPDPSPEGFFSRAITISEIENVKLHIKTHTMHAARGADKVNYAHVMSIPNEDLRLMFQACVDATDAPVQWLTTILAAIGKRGKDLSDPESYQTIGLESCLVKFLTLLIDCWFRAWAETRGCLPPSQNGFRTKHRTSNNAFVLRSAIEKAASKGQLLYTCFIDLRNAFPSVDQPTLWRKLHNWGASGPIIDWLRMLYSRMNYIIRFGGEVADSFQAFAGILIGDPASPILWILFLSDLVILGYLSQWCTGITSGASR
ncbi:hypothetical protein PHLCEN_2v4184 [Hermanssonia centrifuga]|uniref:ribonuclease H n=1 Tax=Hermanssonia centrifuga TaxID=98765 RepID=A0A2R6PZ24_9APHY|nr:hypothetical protein PHLCEN_2v4184 [Hermanssonia centrifuga]